MYPVLSSRDIGTQQFDGNERIAGRHVIPLSQCMAHNAVSLRITSRRVSMDNLKGVAQSAALIR
jgi:hypothetical protein